MIMFSFSAVLITGMDMSYVHQKVVEEDTLLWCF